MSFSNVNKSDQSDKNKAVKHSDPITINPTSTKTRRRSASVSSSSSGSASSPEPPTPLSAGLNNSQRIPSPSTSPILSYFLSQSPSKNPVGATSTFPFKRKFGSVPVFEGLRSPSASRPGVINPYRVDEEPEPEVPVAVHARRASSVVAGRLLQNPILPDSQHERGTNTLRRLSLSSGFIKVSVRFANSI